MPSIEKVKQSVKNTTLGIIILNIIQIILGLFGLVGLILFKILAANEDFIGSVESSTVRQGGSVKELYTIISTLTLVLAILSILAYIVILVFAFINYSRFKNSKAVSMIPYYIGLAFSAYGVLSGFYYFKMSAMLIQGAILAFYVYAFLQARKLQEAQKSTLEDHSPIL